MPPDSPYERPAVTPPVEQWPCTVWSAASGSLAALRRSARSALLRTALQYRRFLCTVAENCEISLTHADWPAASPETTPLVMTGHQPVIFHSGLTFKYETTEQFIIDHQALGLAVMIDTDEGDAGEFSFPVAEFSDSDSAPTRRHTETASFSQGPGLFLNSQLGTRAHRDAVVARVLQALSAAEQHDAAHAFSRTSAIYSRFSPSSMAVANTIVRQAAGIGNRLLEIPLSALCRLPEVIRFFSDILSRPRKFHECYNQVLDQFRKDHSIRNDANPFPNLHTDTDGFELPFWLVHPASGTRSILWLRNHQHTPWLCKDQQPVTELHPGMAGEALLALMAQGWLLVPRGALITASLRLLFSDLFVHGLGGGRYDPATDQLIRAWWQEEPSPFVVASASRCLFPEDRLRLLQMRQFQTQLRDLQFNPGRYLNQQLFPVSVEEQLQSLLAEKEAAVCLLQQHRDTGGSGKDAGRHIQKLSDTIRSLVTSTLQPQIDTLNQLTPQTISTIESRLWPWFFFANTPSPMP